MTSPVGWCLGRSRNAGLGSGTSSESPSLSLIVCPRLVRRAAAAPGPPGPERRGGMTIVPFFQVDNYTQAVDKAYGDSEPGRRLAAEAAGARARARRVGPVLDAGKLRHRRGQLHLRPPEAVGIPPRELRAVESRVGVPDSRCSSTTVTAWPQTPARAQ